VKISYAYYVYDKKRERDFERDPCAEDYLNEHRCIKYKKE